MRAYAVGVASAWGFAWPWVRGATGGGAATGGDGLGDLVRQAARRRDKPP
jgi:hypothetical protein